MMELKLKFWDTFFLIVLGVWNLDYTTAATNTKEFCIMESVNITCPSSHVIIVNKAHFGRMLTSSRCVTTPIAAYDGCKVDVLAIMDNRCSGKDRCQFDLPDPKFYENPQTIPSYNKCPKDVTSYLSVEYSCLKVIPDSRLICRTNKPLLVTSTNGYLSSAVASGSKKLGTHNCPWRIQVPDGQVVNITILNLNRHNINSGTEPCNTYGRISDGVGAKQKTNNIIVCNRYPREKWIYTSTNSTVEIAFDTRLSDTVALLHYQVSGCPNIESHPPKQIVTRTGDQAEITCHRSGAEEKYYLTCKGTEWLGYMNCSSGLPIDDSNGPEGQSVPVQSFPYGLVIVVAVGVALGIFLGGIMLLCVSVYMKRKYHQHDGTYARPDYDIEYNIPGDHCSYPNTLVHHHHHQGGPPPPFLSGTNPPPGNTDTFLHYIRCAKHGVTTTTTQGGVDVTDQFINPDTLTQLNNTSPHTMQPYKTERTNQFSIIKNKDHEYEHPKQ